MSSAAGPFAPATPPRLLAAATLELRTVKGDHLLPLILAENAPLTPARIDAAREAFKRLLAKL